MDSDRKLITPKIKSLFKYVLVNGFLKIGGISFFGWLLIDFAVDYFYYGKLSDYSKDYFVRTFFLAMSLGLVVGIINLFIVKK